MTPDRTTDVRRAVMSSQVIYGRRKRLLGGICLLAAALATTGCGSRLSGPAATPPPC
jgi:hypothetical protein